jgi:hypothetical protein
VRDSHRRGGTRDVISPGPVQVVCGSALCRLRVWDEAEWSAMHPTERPTHAVYVPGIGWVGAVQTEQLN